MPNLAGFTAFARKVGVVAPVSPSFPAGDTSRDAEKRQRFEPLAKSVAPVAPVAPRNDVAWDEEDWQAAFDERAAILEYDDGFTRAEAERLARDEISGLRAAAL
jgi:hypothetical protein